jgi:hypothetical protein
VARVVAKEASFAELCAAIDATAASVQPKREA